MSELKIPKFRTTRSLVKFVGRQFHQHKRGRLPSDRELVFFSSKESADVKARNLVLYVAHVGGRLPPSFESLLLPDPLLIVNYALAANEKIEGDLLDHLKGNSRELVRYARRHGRLPKHLEDSLTEPRWLVSYAQNVLEGRLPEHLEDRLIGDEFNVEQYALKVVRGRASARLPDSLHNYMVMKSFENPNNDDVKSYMEAAASDPDKFQSLEGRIKKLEEEIERLKACA